MPVFFQVPEDAAEPGRLHLEPGARIFTPDGAPFQERATLSGWVELPADTPGLWRFEAVDPGRVQVENLPANFSLADPAFYLEAEPLAKPLPGITNHRRRVCA